jgi:hypothetical protein
VRYWTPHGVREVSTKCTDKAKAKLFAKTARIEEIELNARAGRLTPAILSKTLTGRTLTVAHAKEEWLKWLASSGRQPRTVENYGFEVTVKSLRAENERLTRELRSSL